MSQATLRNNDNNPFLYLEDSTGSACLGTDDAADRVNLIASDAVTNLDPTSGGFSISVDTTANGNIEFAPHGTGQSTFLNGDVEISGTAGASAGNLLMQDTTASGLAGVIKFGGDRFIHNFGATNNTFLGNNAGNFGNTGNINIGIGPNSLLSLTNGAGNVCIGSECGTDLQSGTSNAALGSNAFANAISGSSNIALGSLALSQFTSGNTNTAVGPSSLSGLLTGSINVALGHNSGGAYVGAESSNVVIKSQGVIGDSNKIRIGTQGAGSGQQNECYIAGINGVSVTAAGTVVISSTGQLGTSSAPFSTTWQEVAIDTNMVANNGYIADSGVRLNLTLPVTVPVGIVFEVVNKGAGGWKIVQNAGQFVNFGFLISTVGAAGFIQSSEVHNCVKILCITADIEFIVISSVGNITVA